MKNWTIKQIEAIYTAPFMSLLYDAHTVHIANHKPNEIEAASLLSIKTGACPEDCGYCSQSGHHNTGLKKEKLMPIDDVLLKAKEAKQNGARRFCMGAAWRCPPKKSMPELMHMIAEVKALGLETCMTLGMLDMEDAANLKTAGLDFYNHNLDTSEEYYPKVTTTRTYEDRLKTLANVQQAGMKVCCGGILGLGETRKDRISLLKTLANLSPQPESVPINNLVPVTGTRMANNEPIDSFEFVRTIATARILMPKSVVRLSAGRTEMNNELQALCFFAGANSIFLGERLLTTDNPLPCLDEQLLQKLGICVSSACPV
ncbi:MAG: biotin synthase BioB [Legionellales bacterium RIFCSPHIGHO2_12_FULL_37_14]|nr:MAG: biotin synthase BioB [Legionellales bacterium RIFCSPHIGHO2_12_FULL_37_14]